MNENLHISTPGLNLIKRFEGFVPHIYIDVAGVKTIAWGHALTPNEIISNKYINGITLEDATNLLRQDVIRFEDTIKKYISIELNQNQFDGLLCMIYNTGAGPIISGGLGKAINANNLNLVGDEWLKWCKRKDPKTNTLVVDKGLLNRRKDELSLFLTPVQSNDLTDEEKQQILNLVNITSTSSLDNLYDVELNTEEDKKDDNVS